MGRSLKREAGEDSKDFEEWQRVIKENTEKDENSRSEEYKRIPLRKSRTEWLNDKLNEDCMYAQIWWKKWFPAEK